VIIIGSGPAGLFAGINSTVNGNRALILETNKGAGRKLLLSGSGQCNFTHTGDLKIFSLHYGMKKKEALRILRKYDNSKVLDFFDKNKIKYFAREDGKYFPSSKKAIDILNCLLDIFKENSGEIIYNQKVLDVEKKDSYFIVRTKDRELLTEKLIVATGGMTFPKTGSDGSIHKTLKKMGHKIIEPKFGLTPAYIKDFKLSELSGISFSKASIKIPGENNKEINKTGELLITHKGFSGPLIIDNSRYLKKGMMIGLNFTPFSSFEEFNDIFVSFPKNNGKISVKNLILKSSIPKRLIEKIFKDLPFNRDIKLSQLSKDKRKIIINSFMDYKVEINKLGGINEAMVTVGGVDLGEINLSTMESRLVKDLFFCGEVMDIDGDTGGYNIQLAFSTGFIAGNFKNKK
jgi:predicted Rossmann fold flavoprotein